MMRTLLILGRVSNLPTVWTNCLAGWVLAGGRLDAFGEILALLAGASLLYAGGMALNDVCDAGWDRERAKDRPIPAGKISRGGATVVAGVWLGGGALSLIALNAGFWPLVAALVAAIVLYDLVHKAWQGSTLVMGACRFLLYLTAGCLAFQEGGAGEIPERVWLASGGMFLYIVGITAAARGERTGGRVPWWAWALLVAPVVAWLASDPSPRSVMPASLFIFSLGFSIQALRQARPDRLGCFVSRLLAGIVLIDAAMIALVNVPAAGLCLAFFPLTLLLQRYVPAT